MKKTFDISRLVAITTLIICIVGLFLFLWPPLQGMREMERDFYRNQETLFTARDYLIGLDYYLLRYPPFSGKRGVMGTGMRDVYVEIDNDYARSAMDLLLRRGYQIITKRGNFIVFLRWSNLDNGRGVVYSINGTLPDESVLPFLTRLEPLSYDGWFYYEEDFNEFRIRHQSTDENVSPPHSQ